MDFPGGTSGKESTCLCRRPKRSRFDPWVGKIPWSRKWQPTPLFLPGTSHGQRSLAGCSVWGHRESDTTEHICCCCSGAQLCPTLCNPMDCSTPGLPVLHHLLEFAQTHVHWVGDAIQPSCPLFCTSENVFILLLFLTLFFFWIFKLGLAVLYFQHIKDVLLSFEFHDFWWKNWSHLNLYSSACHVNLSAFKEFSLFLVFSSWIMMCLDLSLFEFFCLGSDDFLKFINICLLLHMGKFSSLFLQVHFVYQLFSPFIPGLLMTPVIPFDIILWIPKTLFKFHCSFSLLLILCIFYWSVFRIIDYSFCHLHCTVVSIKWF